MASEKRARANRRVDHARHYRKDDPGYLAGLIRSTGLSTVEAAARIDISDRSLRAYLSSPDSASYRTAPYVVQVALEALALNL